MGKTTRVYAWISAASDTRHREGIVTLLLADNRMVALVGTDLDAMSVYRDAVQDLANTAGVSVRLDAFDHIETLRKIEPHRRDLDRTLTKGTK